MFSVNIPVHCPEFLECVFILINYQHSDSRSSQVLNRNAGTINHFSRWVMYDSLSLHELKHDRLPCPSPTPGAYSNSCSSHQWFHLTISSSAAHFFCFHLSQHQGLFQWVSSSHQMAKVLKLQLQHHSGQISFRIDCLISLQSKGHSSKTSVLWCSAFFVVQLSHPYMTTGKTIDLTIQNFIGKVMSLLFNMLFRFVIAFLPRSKCTVNYRGI